MVGDGVEDHNAQAYAAVRVLDQVLELAEQLLSIEAFVASGVTALSEEASTRRRSATLETMKSEVRSIIFRNYPGDTTADKLAEVGRLFDGLIAATPPDFTTLSGANGPLPGARGPLSTMTKVNS